MVEALAAGRTAVGTDLNELATFVARIKTLKLTEENREAITGWVEEVVPSIRYDMALDSARLPQSSKRNLTGAGVRVVRKLVALALEKLPRNGGEGAAQLARGAVLCTAQWALDGRRILPSASAFRERLASTATEMVDALGRLWEIAEEAGEPMAPQLETVDAADIASLSPFSEGRKADLVVTSPPYPGVHVLYHRWQVAGGRETPAPYWIAASRDGQGAAFYTMGARNNPNDDVYFSRLGPRFHALRSVMRKGAYLVQVVGFADPQRQLRRYLGVLEKAGFVEARERCQRRIWRDVPGRKWHAVQRSSAPASREVVLVHKAR